MMQMSKEYATALFMLASEENCQKEVSEALGRMVKTFEENSEYVDLLSSPAIPLSERLAAVDGAFSSLHEYAVSFLKLLCEKRYVGFFADAAIEYENLLSASSNILTAKVTSAVSLTQEEENAVKEKLHAKFGNPVILETAVDSEILGGMIIEIDGKVIDASLRQRLGDLKDVISR